MGKYHQQTRHRHSKEEHQQQQKNTSAAVVAMSVNGLALIELGFGIGKYHGIEIYIRLPTRLGTDAASIKLLFCYHFTTFNATARFRQLHQVEVYFFAA